MAMIIRRAVLADSDGWGHHMDWGGGWWWWMAIWGTLMMVALVGLAVWLARNVAGGTSGERADDDPVASARRILAERYARGELTTEEYRERSAELG
jgi:putative membrane protein